MKVQHITNAASWYATMTEPAVSSQHFNEFSVHGEILVETRQFLGSLDTPDWPLDIQLREALLEVGEAFVSTRRYTATGDPQSQTDAKDNYRKFAYSVAGQLRETWLKPAGNDQKTLIVVSEVHYNAAGQQDSETAGNGVITRVIFAKDDGRPIRLVSAVPGRPPLQDLHYHYDPVGNILQLEDSAQPVVFFKNQRVEPINRYRYDSLYQLVEASGRQVMPATYGPALPALLPTPLDPNQLTHYTQTFDYDAAGNLLTRHHTGAPTLSMKAARTSNRSLAFQEDEEDIINGFDPCGNQRQLQQGQHLYWDGRQQLSEVTMVKREDGPDDHERYIYGPRGKRLRKVRITHTGRRTLLAETRYLPGLEIHIDAVHGEERHVITADAGLGQLRIMHWASPPPKNAINDQLRFSLSDLLGSCTLELDKNAGLLNQEGFYPFGGTAWWAGNSALESRYKVRRYSGKERDATGLYYYGYRYYAPWLQRWMSPDPAGNVDGLNRYLMVNNNPVEFFDADGLGRRSIHGYKQGPSSVNTQNIQPIIIHHDPNLNTRFDSLTEESKARFAHVEKNLTHQKLLQYTINSTSATANFNNKFEPHHWQFRYNFRDPKEPNYYASDVARYQYSRIAQDEGFFGQLPSKITRYNVVNMETLKKTKYLKNGTERMLYTFMRETPNGKSTQKILDDFGLKATKVERFTSEGKVHFLIHVKPITTHPTKAHAPSFEKNAVNDSTYNLPNNALPLKHRRTGILSSLRSFLLCHHQTTGNIR